MNNQTFNIQKALSRLSDRDLQIRSWTGMGPEVSSPFDAIYDLQSSGIEDYIIQYRSKFNDKELLKIKEFFDVIEQYDEDESDITKIKNLIDSNNWIEIRRLSADVSNILARIDSIIIS